MSEKGKAAAFQQLEGPLSWPARLLPAIPPVYSDQEILQDKNQGWALIGGMLGHSQGLPLCSKRVALKVIESIHCTCPTGQKNTIIAVTNSFPGEGLDDMIQKVVKGCELYLRTVSQRASLRPSGVKY